MVTLSNGNEIDHNRFLRDPGCFLPSVLRSFTANDENVKKAACIKASWAARKMAVERGEKPINANLPGWLRWNAQTKKVDVDEAKAAVVRRMFALYLETGKLFDVSRTLNAEGAVRVSRKSNGRGHSKDFIFRCLTNRAVLGECMGKPGLFPAIVDDQSFYRVAERLKAGKHNTANRKAKASNILSGLAVCSKCGAPLHKHSQSRNGKVYPYLVCGATLRGTGNCGMASVNYDILAQSFLGVLLAKDDSLLRAVLTGGRPGPSKLETLKAKLADAEARAEKLCRLIEGEENPSKRLLARLNEIEAEENALRGQVMEEEANIKAQPSPVRAYDALRNQFPDPVKITDHARLRLLLQDVVAKVVVNIAEDSFSILLKGRKEPISVAMIKAR